MSDHIEHNKQLFHVPEWSEGYFDINEQGELVACNPDKHSVQLSLSKLAKEMRDDGWPSPLLIRFSNILRDRQANLCNAFNDAIAEQDYQGRYSLVYPIKVNQQRAVVEELVTHGSGQFGLEAGSKPELMAVLGLPMPTGSVVVCNGYKDREYVQLALIGQLMGREVHIVIEKQNELDLVLEEAAKLGVKPNLGLRVRLMSMGKGKWQNTGGAKSKFGLSASQVLGLVEKLKSADQLDRLRLLHFHLGSQIADIQDIQRGLKECSRFFVELHRLGAPVSVVDVGGGLGVDYEGTRSHSDASVNYSLADYAQAVVSSILQVCEQHDLPHPDLITESGRALTAHHAVLIANLIDFEPAPGLTEPTPAGKGEPVVVRNLSRRWSQMTEENLAGSWHDANYLLSEAQTLFTHGVIQLNDWARAEQFYYALARKAASLLNDELPGHNEVRHELQEKLADKAFVNFSLFQSLPDAWGIDQLFPVMPLQGLDQPLVQRAVLQDITCDSDGCIEQYSIDRERTGSMAMPKPLPNLDHYIGIFMVGAYQEILGAMHNLFGDTHAVHLQLDDDGEYQIVEQDRGDTVADALRYVHYDPDALLNQYRSQLERAEISAELRHQAMETLQAGLDGYTYLED